MLSLSNEVQFRFNNLLRSEIYLESKIVMRRIGILTAGGDTPALNATIYGAVERANSFEIEVVGIMRGFEGLMEPRLPHLLLNPLACSIPELDPCIGGTLLGASRTYVNPEDHARNKEVVKRLEQLKIDGLICIGGDGTINGMQPLSDYFPCVLSPKTIDNDLGLNYIDEPNEWLLETDAATSDKHYRKLASRKDIELDEIINYATPGFATSVFVVTQGVTRIRTTAESHRRIAIVEVMGRESGYIALGSAYGQPDIILIPEVPLNLEHLLERVRELYDLQKHVVIVIGEGVVDEQGNQLGAMEKSVDPAGNIVFSGAAEHLKRILVKTLGDSFFHQRGRADGNADSAIFTRKVGHTQRGGRPIRFDRYYATQLGGKAVDILVEGKNNSISTLQWNEARGFFVDELAANKLRDKYGGIHARAVHGSFYDVHRFQPSKLGVCYLQQIFTNALGTDDMEHMRTTMFSPSNLTRRYQSINIDVSKRLRFLSTD